MSNTINISPAAYDAGAADHAGATSPAKPAAAGTAPPAADSNAEDAGCAPTFRERAPAERALRARERSRDSLQ